MTELFLLALAGFGAGVVNSIAGGGTFLTFPALVWAGVPPVTANATSAVAVFPGYASAAAGFRAEIEALDRPALWRATILALAGGLAGGLLLLISSDAVFAVIVPFLLFFATLVFAFQSRIQNWMHQSPFKATPYGAVGLVSVSIYGGYFNGGLGIVLLALFALWGMDSLAQMNGLKNALSFMISAISVATFAVAGLVVWPQALLMAMAAILGGYAGARLSRILPARVVRGAIVAIGFGMSAVFFARL